MEIDARRRIPPNFARKNSREFRSVIDGTRNESQIKRTTRNFGLLSLCCCCCCCSCCCCCCTGFSFLIQTLFAFGLAGTDFFFTAVEFFLFKKKKKRKKITRTPRDRRQRLLQSIGSFWNVVLPRYHAPSVQYRRRRRRRRRRRIIQRCRVAHSRDPVATVRYMIFFSLSAFVWSQRNSERENEEQEDTRRLNGDEERGGDR